jgi:hypothetical protein
MFLVCSVYDFVLMLKPKRKTSMTQDAMSKDGTQK